MQNKPPKRPGDRKDAYLVRDADPMHSIMSRLLGGRPENEAVMSDRVELTAAEEYLARRNAENPEYKYTLFHLICAAVAKTVALRPKMNRFMKDKKLFEREDISISFVAKNKFSDSGSESLVIWKVDESEEAKSPIEQAHDCVCRAVYKIRTEKKTDDTTGIINRLTRLPDFLFTLAVAIIRRLDRKGRLPAAFRSANPYDTSVFLSNLGSIKMSASYHHLSDFGTNSVFAIIGKKDLYPYFQADGSCEMREAVELGITVDERIADGFYFAGSVRLLNYLLRHPALLEQPLYTPVSWEEI